MFTQLKIVMKNILLSLFLLPILIVTGHSQNHHSVARQWNEALLQAIRNDFARPPVHARNLFHTSIALYDAWAAYDEEAETFFLGKTFGNYTCRFEDMPATSDIQKARETAMSYAAYRLITHRFARSPKIALTQAYLDSLFQSFGYDPSFESTDYSTGSAAALGNYLAKELITFGLQDGSNEENDYTNQYYYPRNGALAPALPGVGFLRDPNRWQPLSFELFIDQSGNPIPGGSPPFISPEWGQVIPFALTSSELTTYEYDGFNYLVYHDPGEPCYLDFSGEGRSKEYQWNFSMVATWGAHHNPNDGVLWDISPASIGNSAPLPTTFEEYQDFYDYREGGTMDAGHSMNPKTGLPYPPQIVPRGDYVRVLAEFWADGPNSETPPGHWFTILNYVNDHPQIQKRFAGKGEIIDDLEWDVKTYLALGGAMHDAAISAWGVKGWYDYVRPISAIRYMARLGQCSDPNAKNYNPAGIPLVPRLIETVELGDTLAGENNEHVGKIKLYNWRGPTYITDPETEYANVGWILAENWWPYQRPTFVTPPFAGYVSGHSTFSRAAAEVLTALTGDSFFPGGVGEFYAPKNEFLEFEEGPSVDITLQWATYRDASDQTSLSRIWGGIHPPIDDIPGRRIGIKVAEKSFERVRRLFYKDADNDGFYSYEDCNDLDANINPNRPELCDGMDNNCNSLIDEALTVSKFYKDADGDGYGDPTTLLDTCLTASALSQYVDNNLDCNDRNAKIYPNADEISDNGIDEDCSGLDLYQAFKVFPNPVQNVLTIRFDAQEQLEIKISDMTGRLLQSKFSAGSNNNFEFNVQGLPSGVYLFELHAEGGKLLKQFKMLKM